MNNFLKILLSIILFIIALFKINSNEPSICPLNGKCRDLPKGDGYCIDRYTLTLQKIKGEKHLTIHGLWPSCKSQCETYSGALCCGENYDYFNIDSKLLTRLNRIWPSIYGNNMGFWKSEWLKHGTCALKKMNENGIKNSSDYFSKVLKIYDSLKLHKVYSEIYKYDLKYLTKRKDSAKIHLIENKIKEITGFRALLQYNGEIQFCFDKYLNKIDC
jgi:ribonuclease T2